MNVRNAMRKNGYTEVYLGVKNLDDVYVEAIEHAILVNSVGEIMVPVVSNAIPFWNRKRLIIAAVLMLTSFIITIVLA